MVKKIMMPILAVVVLSLIAGCGLENEGWSGNLEQTIGITGTYIVVSQSGCQTYTSFTFTQMENVVEAVDDLGNQYDGWATQDLVNIEDSPKESSGTTTVNYYYRTISVTISGTLRTGQTVTLVLTPIYRNGDSVSGTAGLKDDNEPYVPWGLQGTFTDDTGCSGYIEMQGLYTDITISA